MYSIIISCNLSFYYVFTGSCVNMTCIHFEIARKGNDLQMHETPVNGLPFKMFLFANIGLEFCLVNIKYSKLNTMAKSTIDLTSIIILTLVEAMSK